MQTAPQNRCHLFAQDHSPLKLDLPVARLGATCKDLSLEKFTKELSSLKPSIRELELPASVINCHIQHL